MNDDDEALRSALAEPALERSAPAFAASVLYRLGARRRLRRHLLRMIIGAGVIGLATILAPGLGRSLGTVLAGPHAAILVMASIILPIALTFSLLARRGTS